MEKINKLKVLRKKLGLTQMQMAEKLQMEYNNYLRYEWETYKKMTREMEEYISNVTGYEFSYRPNSKLERLEDIPDFQKSLKQLREERGLTQVEIIKLLDMTYSNYVNYEHGKYKEMSEELEKKISDVLGIEYHYRRG